MGCLWFQGWLKSHFSKILTFYNKVTGPEKLLDVSNRFKLEFSAIATSNKI